MFIFSHLQMLYKAKVKQKISSKIDNGLETIKFTILSFQMNLSIGAKITNCLHYLSFFEQKYTQIPVNQKKSEKVCCNSYSFLHLYIATLIEKRYYNMNKEFLKVALQGSKFYLPIRWKIWFGRFFYYTVNPILYAR